MRKAQPEASALGSVSRAELTSAPGTSTQTRVGIGRTPGGKTSGGHSIDTKKLTRECELRFLRIPAVECRPVESLGAA